MRRREHRLGARGGVKIYSNGRQRGIQGYRCCRSAAQLEQQGFDDPLVTFGTNAVGELERAVTDSLVALFHADPLRFLCAGNLDSITVAANGDELAFRGSR